MLEYDDLMNQKRIVEKSTAGTKIRKIVHSLVKTVIIQENNAHFFSVKLSNT